MKKLLFYLMILLTGFFGFSQQEKFQKDIAALKSLIVIAQKDKNINNELFFRYKLLGLEVKNVNYNQAYLEGLEIEEIIILNPTSDSVISLSPRFYKTMGWIMTTRVQYEKSIEYYKKAIQFARGQNKSHFIFDVKVSIAFCSHLLGKKKEAHKLAKNLMKEAKEQNDEMLISKGHYLYYLLFNEERDYENSLYHIKLCQLGPSISEKAFRLINIGTAYLNIQNIDSALVYTLKGLKIAEDSNEIQIQANAHIQLKTIYLKLEDYKNAMYHSEKFNQITEKSASFKAGMELVKINNEILEEKIKLQQELSSEKLKNQRLIIWLILIALFLHISGIIYTLNKIKIIEKQKILIEKEKIKAEESEKYKEQFLANMSHEIRTPMHAISGITNILLRKKHPKELDRYLDAMKISSDNLLILLDDILDLSKIESGKLEFYIDHYNPYELVNQVIHVILYQAQNKGIELLLNIEQGLPDLIYIDESRIKQVLINLLGNAVKFTDQGRVTLRVTLVRDWPEQVELLFEVEDTGIGIAADHRRHHRGIGHPQPRHPLHPQPCRIHHRLRIHPHLAGANGVIDGQRLGPQIGEDVVIALHPRTRQHFGAADRGEGGGGEDAAGELDAFDQRALVMVVREEAVVDFQCQGAAAAGKAQFADRPGAQDAGMDGIAMAIFDQPPAMAAIAGHEMELHIRFGIGQRGAGKAACLDIIGGQHPLARRQIAQWR